MKPSQLLKEKGWCQKAFARDMHGDKVSPLSDYAVCYCLVGALTVCCSKGFPIKPSDYLTTSIKYINSNKIYKWNDEKGRTKEEVIELCEKVEKELGL